MSFLSSNVICAVQYTYMCRYYQNLATSFFLSHANKDPSHEKLLISSHFNCSTASFHTYISTKFIILIELSQKTVFLHCTSILVTTNMSNQQEMDMFSASSIYFSRISDLYDSIFREWWKRGIDYSTLAATNEHQDGWSSGMTLA